MMIAETRVSRVWDEFEENREFYEVMPETIVSFRLRSVDVEVREVRFDVDVYGGVRLPEGSVDQPPLSFDVTDDAYYYLNRAAGMVRAFVVEPHDNDPDSDNYVLGDLSFGVEDE